MLVSPWPSRSSALQAPTLCEEPFNFTPLRPVKQLGGQKSADKTHSGSLAGPQKKSTAKQPSLHRPTASRPRQSQDKTPMLCRRPVVSLSLTAKSRASTKGAEIVLRANFLFKTRAGYMESLRTYLTSSTRPAWRYHVPRIWNRSINGCEFPVKRKTQNVVDLFVSRLFVVVPFLNNSSACNAFGACASRAKMTASNCL